MPEYNLDAPVNTVAQQRLNNKAFLEGQNVLTSDFLNKFGSTIAGQGTTQGAAERIGGELGLPALRQNAFNLQQQMIDIPEVYKAGTRGFDVNANQLARIINQRTTELAPLAQRATSQAQFGEQELGTRLGYLQNDWNRQLLPLTTEKDFLTDRMLRETTMYSQDNQRELDTILDKIRNGITISEAEKDRAQALSIAEKGYESALKQIAETAKYATPKSPWESITSGGALYNTATGKTIHGPKAGGNNGW